MAPIVVHFRCVSYTSYRFLQTSPLASDALAIQIVFPVIGATLASFSEAGLPALPGKQKWLATIGTRAMGRRWPEPSPKIDPVWDLLIDVMNRIVNVELTGGCN